MSESNVELARRGFEAAAAGDFDLVATLLDDDVKWHGGDPSAAGACRNRAQALQFMRAARRHGRLGDLVDVVGEADRVVVIMKPSSAPSGKPPALVANLTTFRDGKVVEMVHYSDPEDAFAAAGVRHHDRPRA